MGGFMRSAPLLLALAFAGSACAQGVPSRLPAPEELRAWRDSISVDGRRFAVPERWRGLRLGLRDAPPPADLVLLPPELSARGREVSLRLPAALSFRAMAAEAALDGIALRAESGYRSPDTQERLIATRLAQGREFEEILRGVAPPGYSEHMLGTTLDLALGGGYAQNPAYHWLKANAGRFGWRETYPDDGDDRFPWEPWHWRWNAAD